MPLNSNPRIPFSDSNAAMASISIAYANAEHFSTKRQILAIVAGDFPFSTLQAHFPDATEDLIKQARKHAYSKGE
jgi:hypothetical protein